MERMKVMETMSNVRGYRKVLPFLLLAAMSLCCCWFFVGRYGIFGSRVDWISQHSVIPDYFRQQFYDTGELFPEFAANIGGGQNIYHFSYYGLFSPMVLVSYLFPHVKMGNYLMAASIASLIAAVMLLYGWLLKRGFSGKISFMVSLMYLLSGPMIFHSYCQLMFVNYMPFLCMAFMGVDSYFEKGKKLLYTASVFLMIMTSFYFSIGGMLALVLYGLYRYLECDVQKRCDLQIKIIACDTNKRKDIFSFTRKKHSMQFVFSFLLDGIRFLCPMLMAVLMSGVLLVPTAAALTGRGGGKGEVSLASLLIPNIQADRLVYTPYAIGLTTLLITVLITGFSYKKAYERVLSWGCTIILMIPFFTWALNGGLYIREKALIPFLPLLCYLIACYVKKLEDGSISKHIVIYSFLLTVGLFCAGQQTSEFSAYGTLYLIDAVIMVGCGLLFYLKKNSMFILVPPVVFLILFGSVFHKRANRIESREFYEKVTDQAIGQVIGEVLEEEQGFYRLEQVGNEEENAADLNRIWNMGQYISSIYSSSYNKEYQDFRKNVFGVEEPFRNDLMQSVSWNPVFLKLMGVRYLVSEQEIPGYEFVRKAGKMSVYENRDTAPIAYVTDQMISEEAYAGLSFPYNQMALNYGVVREGDAEEIEKQILEDVRQALEPAGIVLPEQENDSLQISRKGDGYRVQAKKKTVVEIEVSGSEELSEDETERILFLRFSIKNNKPEQDAAIWLEGERNKLSARNHTYYNGNTAFSFGVVMEKGKKSVELALGKGDYELTNVECFLGDWGRQANQERSGRLYQMEFQTDQERTGGNVISGSVNVEREGYFVTSIPFDSNFEIWVDGKAIECEKVNTAFLGFPIGKGRHAVEMVYHAPGRKVGAWCSVAGIGMFLVAAVYGLRSRKPQRM